MTDIKESYTIRFRKFISEVSRIHSNEMTTSKKRTYEESFGERNFEVERYGQEIGERFFDENLGQGV